ncbi:MAG TPA: hypothetical protein PK491_06480, partial [Candidatus Hydrogenedentes bacterium]|nr:hypothetical protein [Candidatus Hydrogenedentota bacterium]
MLIVSPLAANTVTFALIVQDWAEKQSERRSRCAGNFQKTEGQRRRRVQRVSEREDGSDFFNLPNPAWHFFRNQPF